MQTDMPSLLELASAQEHVGDCVHCGMCLDSCPTYVLWGQEADSPRGRITQIGDAIANDGAVSAEMATHIDTCLGCMACVTACPSGVAYDRLLTEARPAVEQQHQRSPSERALRLLLFETLPYPDRLRALVPALSAARRMRTSRLPERLAALAKVAPEPPTREQLRTPLPEFTPALGQRRGRVGLLLGCVQRVFFSDVHRATVGLLTAEGYDVHAPQLPDCCGALELSAGEQEHGLARAQATIAAFAELGDLDAIIANAAGCGAAMKDYGLLLGTEAAWAFSGRVRDATEFLAEIEPRAARGPVPLRVVYHDACHLSHAQGITAQPRQLLGQIPQLELLEVGEEAAICCGSAGVYNVLQPTPAAELGRRKAEHLIATGAQVIAAANPGCAAQIGRHCGDLGTAIPVQHPVELLWRSVQSARRTDL